MVSAVQLYIMSEVIYHHNRLFCYLFKPVKFIILFYYSTVCRIFKACWAVIRSWLDPVTAQKVNFMALSALSDHIADEHMPDDLTMSLP
jgi:hypothetical protein